MPKAHRATQSPRRTNRFEDGDALLRAVHAHHTRQRHRRFVVALATGQRRQARPLHARRGMHALLHRPPAAGCGWVSPQKLECTLPAV